MCPPSAKFIGYVEYEPTHYHAEFVVTGSVILPDNSQVNWDTLKRLGIAVPEFPDFYTWTRRRFERRIENLKFLRRIK